MGEEAAGEAKAGKGAKAAMAAKEAAGQEAAGQEAAGQEAAAGEETKKAADKRNGKKASFLRRARDAHRGVCSDATAVLKVLAGFSVGFRQVLGASIRFRGFRKSFRTGFRQRF